MPCKRQVAGSSPAGSIMWARSSVGRAGRLSNSSSPQLQFTGGNAGRDYIFVQVERRPRHPSSRHSSNAGECRWEYIGRRLRPAVRLRKLSSPLVAGTDQTGECRSDYMVRAPAKAGGRRFDSASGQPDSSAKMSDHNSSPTVSSAANAVGTTWSSVSPVRVRPNLRVRSSVVRA